MRIPMIGRQFLALAVVAGMMSGAARSQKAGAQANAQTATNVSAEMVKGKLNPEKSKPGDEVQLRLKDDVKSNGAVVLKKGTVVTGVVRDVKQTEAKGAASGQAQSMMRIEWLAPAMQGSAFSNVTVALQSFSQVSPLYDRPEDNPVDLPLRASGAGSASSSAAAGRSGGGLLGGAVGAVGGVTSSAGAAGGVGAGTLGTVRSVPAVPNVPLQSMPSVVAANTQTAAALQNNFGLAGNSQLFQTGHGEIVTAGGSRQSVDLFSHMNNDTVLTSPSRNFELNSGTQMQLLIGVEKN